MKKIYLAHPISKISVTDVFDYYDSISEELEHDYEILSPMSGKDDLRSAKEFKDEGYDTPINCNHAIFERDTWMVSQCDVLLCDFTGAEAVSIGCCMELAIASWLRKHTVVVLPDGNVHNHAFIREAADIVFSNMSDALSYLAHLA